MFLGEVARSAADTTANVEDRAAPWKGAYTEEESDQVSLGGLFGECRRIEIPMVDVLAPFDLAGRGIIMGSRREEVTRGNNSMKRRARSGVVFAL